MKKISGTIQTKPAYYFSWWFSLVLFMFLFPLFPQFFGFRPGPTLHVLLTILAAVIYAVPLTTYRLDDEYLIKYRLAGWIPMKRIPVDGIIRYSTKGYCRTDLLYRTMAFDLPIEWHEVRVYAADGSSMKVLNIRMRRPDNILIFRREILRHVKRNRKARGKGALRE